jgi:hypothetical protein
MDHYVKIYDWMLELGLNGRELNALAVITSFGKGGEWFQGSASYLGKWMGVKRKHTILDALSSLVSKGLIEKRERWEKGQHLCDYRPVRTPHQGGAKTSPRPGAESSLHNNRPDSDNIEIKNKETVRLTLDEFKRRHRQ